MKFRVIVLKLYIGKPIGSFSRVIVKIYLNYYFRDLNSI
jgi:hypothetical protein